MYDVKIFSDGDKTEIYVDGVPMGNGCYGFSLAQDGGDTPVLNLRLAVDKIEYEGKNISVSHIADVQKRLLSEGSTVK